MPLTISIATMNSREHLRACLNSLPAACAGVTADVWVVDNCSTDGTRNMLEAEYPDVKVISNDRPLGFGANHNQVLQRVLSDAGTEERYVLVLNDDVIASPGSLLTLVEAARSEAATGAVVPRVVAPDGSSQRVAFADASSLKGIAAVFMGRDVARERPEDAQWLNACCLLLPVGVLRVVGGFDERFFMYCEDTDLSMRIRSLGYRLWKCERSEVLHLGGQTTGQGAHVSSMQLQMQRSTFLLLEKQRGRMRALAVVSSLRLAHAVRGAAALAAGRLAADDARVASARGRLALARYDPRRAVFPDREVLPR